MTHVEELKRGLAEALDRSLRELREGVESDAEAQEEAERLWGASVDFNIVNRRARTRREYIENISGTQQ